MEVENDYLLNPFTLDASPEKVSITKEGTWKEIKINFS